MKIYTLIIMCNGGKLVKISFSTLACPEYSWSDIYSMAKDIGFDGIEIRGLGNEIFAVNAQPFSENKISDTIKTLERLNLEIPCLSSGCGLKYLDKTEEILTRFHNI
jgi:fatty-acyl-CoA synthase